MLERNTIETNDEFVIEYEAVTIELERKDFTSFEHIDNLVKSYTEKIDTIALQLSEDESFIMFYGNHEIINIIFTLGKPNIRYIKDWDSGVISYINQGFDDSHIIDIEFEGLMKSFYNISIDG